VTRTQDTAGGGLNVCLPPAPVDDLIVALQGQLHHIAGSGIAARGASVAKWPQNAGIVAGPVEGTVRYPASGGVTSMWRGFSCPLRSAKVPFTCWSKGCCHTAFAGRVSLASQLQRGAMPPTPLTLALADAGLGSHRAGVLPQPSRLRTESSRAAQQTVERNGAPESNCPVQPHRGLPWCWLDEALIVLVDHAGTGEGDLLLCAIRDELEVETRKYVMRSLRTHLCL
jgi:hypothetical protein